MTDLLVVDIGNTTTRMGRWRHGVVEEVSVHASDQTPASFAAAAGLMPARGSLGNPPCHVALSSVVPPAEAAWRDWCEQAGRPLFVLHGDTPTPLANHYREPARLGPDRLAAAVGAFRRLGAPTIVVSLGTATVVDAVSAQPAYLGGAIAAGVETGLAALAEKAAALPRTTADTPDGIVGHDTEECLRVGAVLGTAALVEGLVVRLRSVVGEKALVALTGGHAELISEQLSLEHEVFPALTLEGIGAIWEHNHRGS